MESPFHRLVVGQVVGRCHQLLQEGVATSYRSVQAGRRTSSSQVCIYIGGRLPGKRGKSSNLVQIRALSDITHHVTQADSELAPLPRQRVLTLHAAQEFIVLYVQKVLSIHVYQFNKEKLSTGAKDTVSQTDKQTKISNSNYGFIDVNLYIISLLML